MLPQGEEGGVQYSSSEHRLRIPTKPGRCTLAFRRIRLAVDHRARSAVMCSASRMESELHPAKIVPLKAHRIPCVWMNASDELLPILALPLPETAAVVY